MCLSSYTPIVTKRYTPKQPASKEQKRRHGIEKCSSRRLDVAASLLLPHVAPIQSKRLFECIYLTRERRSKPGTHTLLDWRRPPVKWTPDQHTHTRAHELRLRTDTLPEDAATGAEHDCRLRQLSDNCRRMPRVLKRKRVSTRPPTVPEYFCPHGSRWRKISS